MGFDDNERPEDLVQFADDEVTSPQEPANAPKPWKILIVDDDEVIHRVTELALRGFVLHGRPLTYLHAYSGQESVDLMQANPDVAMVLMDVVMETEHAGLDAVRRIREELGNRLVRIILRTGQPGQAPEREVVSNYDINDYKEKTELTARKLFTVVHTGISLYRELVAMERSRKGLRNVIAASSSMLEVHSMEQFARGVLEQLSAMLHSSLDSVIVRQGVTAQDRGTGHYTVLVGTGGLSGASGQVAEDVLADEALDCIQHARSTRFPVFRDRHFAMQFSPSTGDDYVVYLSTNTRISEEDAGFIELFCQNVALAFENLAMHREVAHSQRQVIMLLSSSIEERSPELKHHVQRVSRYAERLGRLLGLGDQEIDLLSIGAALHDLGKIGVPEAVLGKRGPLDAEERAQMETHVERGTRMLEGQNCSLLKASREVVGQHHERWDGTGYPNRLSGEDIHLFGRITAIADVFDALTTTRCYKQPWPIEKVRDYFREQAGAAFDPKLANLFLDNLDDFVDIKESLSKAA